MLGSAEIIIILCVIMLLFGGKKLPELARSLGKGIREFKSASQGIEEEISISPIEEKHDSDKKTDG
jgi:sec-independent protein translocase protein TatA